MSEREPPPGEPESGWEPAWEAEPVSPARPRRGHRAPVGLRQLAGRLLAPAVAVGVVVAVVLLLILINASPSGQTPSNAADAVAPPTAAPAHTPPSTPAPSGTRSTPPSVTPTTVKPTTVKPTTVKPTTSPTPSGRPAPSGRSAAMAPVQVLNNSRRTGLAHEVASLVAARGWQIVIVGNLQGTVAESTVYYSPGDRAAAQHLAREFGSIQRVEPNAAAGLHQSGITLVLTTDWAG